MSRAPTRCSRLTGNINELLSGDCATVPSIDNCSQSVRFDRIGRHYFQAKPLHSLLTYRSADLHDVAFNYMEEMVESNLWTGRVSCALMFTPKLFSR